MRCRLASFVALLLGPRWHGNDLRDGKCCSRRQRRARCRGAARCCAPLAKCGLPTVWCLCGVTTHIPLSKHICGGRGVQGARGWCTGSTGMVALELLSMNGGGAGLWRREQGRSEEQPHGDWGVRGLGLGFSWWAALLYGCGEKNRMVWICSEKRSDGR
jgi:hypothetical protein